jgi:hypothetical protein
MDAAAQTKNIPKRPARSPGRKESQAGARK